MHATNRWWVKIYCIHQYNKYEFFTIVHHTWGNVPHIFLHIPCCYKRKGGLGLVTQSPVKYHSRNFENEGCSLHFAACSGCRNIQLLCTSVLLPILQWLLWRIQLRQLAAICEHPRIQICSILWWLFRLQLLLPPLLPSEFLLLRSL